MGKGTDFSLNATAKGPLDRLAVKGNLTSNAGAADVDLTLRNVLDRKRPISIGGHLRTRDLDAGRIAGIKELGPVTLRHQGTGPRHPDDRPERHAGAPQPAGPHRLPERGTPQRPGL